MVGMMKIPENYILQKQNSGNNPIIFVAIRERDANI